MFMRWRQISDVWVDAPDIDPNAVVFVAVSPQVTRILPWPRPDVSAAALLNALDRNKYADTDASNFNKVAYAPTSRELKASHLSRADLAELWDAVDRVIAARDVSARALTFPTIRKGSSTDVPLAPHDGLSSVLAKYADDPRLKVNH